MSSLEPDFRARFLYDVNADAVTVSAAEVSYDLADPAHGSSKLHGRIAMLVP